MSHQVNDQITLAFNTSVPLGLSSGYPANTFGTLASPHSSPPTKSKMDSNQILLLGPDMEAPWKTAEPEPGYGSNSQMRRTLR